MKKLILLLIPFFFILSFVVADQLYFSCASNSHFIMYCGGISDSQINNPFNSGIVPIITIVSPYNNNIFYTSPNNINLNYTVTSPTGLLIDSCWYNLNGTNITLPSCSDTTINASGNGKFTIKLFSKDSVGNIGYSSKTFNVGSTGGGGSIRFPNQTIINKIIKEGTPILVPIILMTLIFLVLLIIILSINPGTLKAIYFKLRYGTENEKYLNE